MYDVIIIGGGIIGLTTGYRLLQKHPAIKLVVLEKEAELAAHQTGHNSGVIHSGIYYEPGSLKARNCREGVRRLLNFCDTRDIPYDRCGKVIVATCESDLPRLQDLFERGKANGVPDLELIGPERLKEIEPHTRGLKALFVPGTGIVDFTEVANACAVSIKNRGGLIKSNAEVVDCILQSDRCLVETTGGDFEASLVINCAGLYSDKVAELVDSTEEDIKIIPFRGEYYLLKPDRRFLVNHLIYPVPDPRFPFLGVHFTRKLDGSVEAGPNAVLALAREGYRKSDVNLPEFWDTLSYPGFWSMAREYWKTGLLEYGRSLFKPVFVKALRKLIPEITGDDLTPGGSGVRAQAVSRNGKLIDDFYIRQNKRVIGVLNAPSPAATASFMIADYIVESFVEQVI